MATEKVGVYRKWRGPVPTDASGMPLSKSDWTGKRSFSWAVRWFGGDGKRYSKSFSTRKEADRFAEAKQQQVRQGQADPPARITLRDFYWEHKELMTGKSAPATLNMQLATLALLAAEVGWDAELRRITPLQIERFSSDRSNRVKPITVNKEVKTLKCLFNKAIQRRYLPKGSNPTDGITLAKIGKKRKAYVSKEQFELIYAKATTTLWRVLLVVLYTTGLRKREAQHLTWNDIDFAVGELFVVQRDAKGYIQKWTPKDHELRTIPLPKQAVDLLTKLQALAPENCPYVFMEPGRWDYYRQQVDGGTWRPGVDICHNWLRRFDTLCKHAGVEKFSLHDLRRSCITNWARKLPIHVTQQLAGHSDIHTTQSYYLSVQKEDLARAKRVQGQLMAGLKDLAPADPKLTHKGPKRDFPKRKEFGGVPKPPE